MKFGRESNSATNIYPFALPFQLIVRPKVNLIITLTRGGVGFWNLENGNLEHVVTETPSGGQARVMRTARKDITLKLII